MSAISSLYEEVEHKANDRFLDVIDRLIARRPLCRRLIALHEYVSVKLTAHHQRKHERSYDLNYNPRCLSNWVLENIIENKRSDYYATDCDCGDCILREKSEPNPNKSFVFRSDRIKIKLRRLEHKHARRDGRLPSRQHT